MLMSVPSFVRIERGSDGGPRLQNLQCALFCSKPVIFNVSRSADPRLALVPASCYNCDVKQSNLNVFISFIRIERGSDGSP